LWLVESSSKIPLKMMVKKDKVHPAVRDLVSKIVNKEKVECAEINFSLNIKNKLKIKQKECKTMLVEESKEKDGLTFQENFKALVRQAVEERKTKEKELDKAVEERKNLKKTLEGRIKPGSRMKCDRCDYKSSITKYVSRHNVLAHSKEGRTIIPCDECEYQTDTEKDMKRHIYCTHTTLDTIYYPCEACGFNTPSIKTLAEHKKLHCKWLSIVKSFRCRQCPYSSNIKDKLKDHQQVMHIKSK